MLDLVLRNARVVDGTGQPAFSGDIGIHNGRIVSVGTVLDKGLKEIDVQGSVAAPGFIDVHCHYDAQVFWDPMLTPSVNHGVTTVIGGNCGFTLAPLSGKPEDADYLLRMLSRVEGMPLGTLRSAIKPNWKSFGDYLNCLDGELAINATFLVGHTAIRRAVMGDRAVGCESTPEELDAMCELLDRSLKEGGAGFSTTVSHTHTDYEGKPVPSRWATRDELLRLAEVVSRHPGTWVEFAHGMAAMGEEQYALGTDLSLAAQRAVNWNLVTVDAECDEERQSQLRAGNHALERGGVVYGLVPAVPPKIMLNFVSGFVLDMIPGWSEVILKQHAEKIAALTDPVVRRVMIEGAKQIPVPSLARKFADWNQMVIESIGSPDNQSLVGTLLGDYARSVSKDPITALFDLAVKENLALSFSPPPGGEDDASWQLRADTWRDDRCIIGASDAGAHLDMINTFAFSTQLLGEGVRRRALLPLEEAVHRITHLPARRFGLKDRGLIACGMAADVTIFDPATIDCGPVQMRADLPENEYRLTADAVGVHYVIVNGTPVIANGQLTGAKGGKILRSGKDTTTVSLSEHISGNSMKKEKRDV